MEKMFGEEGYEWPCKRCRKVFTPKKMIRLGHFQTCCDDCQALNLLEMIFSEPDEFEPS